MKLNKRKKAFEIIKSGVRTIDPYGLIKGGAPEDEFDSEIKSILNQLDRCKSEMDLAKIISRVLSSAFSKNYDYKLFVPYANDIFKSLKVNGILE